MKPEKKVEKFISETKTESIDGIKYTTYYVNRPIEPGDPQGSSIGSQSMTIEVIKYVYNNK